MAGANERPILRRYIMTMCDGLVPELQRRRLTRTRYATSTSRTTRWNSSGLNLTLGARRGIPLADPKRRQGGVLDHSVLTQSGLMQPPTETLVVTCGCFAVEQQAEPILTGEIGGGRGGLHLDEGIGHAKAAQALGQRVVSIVSPFNGSGRGRGCFRGTGLAAPADPPSCPVRSSGSPRPSCTSGCPVPAPVHRPHPAARRRSAS